MRQHRSKIIRFPLDAKHVCTNEVTALNRFQQHKLQYRRIQQSILYTLLSDVFKGSKYTNAQKLAYVSCHPDELPVGVKLIKYRTNYARTASRYTNALFIDINSLLCVLFK